MSRTLLSAALLFAVAGAAQAATATGDASRGRVLVYTCAGCHGQYGYENAYPNYRVPRIAGQNYDYLIAAMHEYRDGGRSHPTMHAQMDSMSEEDIKDIATYLSSLQPAK